MAINRTFNIYKKDVVKSGEFIMEYGRDIEKALFGYYFDKGSSSGVVGVLESYLNDDGGVGGLEPDVEYDGSTPAACAMFFSMLHDMKINAEFDAVKRVLGYLEKSISKKNSWPPAVPGAMEAPRASWRNWSPEKEEAFALDPTCELTAYFYHFGGGDYRAFSKEMLDTLYSELVQRFLGTLEPEDIKSLMQLCRVLPDVAAERFIAVLRPHLKEMLVTDKGAWGSYCMSPLSVFKSPLDPLYYEFEKEISLNLDYEIANLSEDCVWQPNRSWGQFEEEFAKRKNMLAAHATMTKLVQLKNFGRIARIN